MPGAGYRPGIPQSDQPYTKWDTDKDEVEVDYKQMGGNPHKRNQWFSGPKGSFLKFLLVVVIFLVGLMLGYVIRRSTHDDRPRTRCLGYTNGFEGYSTDLSKEIQNTMSAERIMQNLKNYSSSVHMSGTRDNNVLQETLATQLASYHLQVKHTPYSVLLSYPNWTYPNTISLLADNGTTVYQTQFTDGAQPNQHPELAEPFNAFSPAGSVEGELMYANFGEESDFQELKKHGLECNNTIVIMRYGRILRSRKVLNAAECGAKGAILYSDPSQVTDSLGGHDEGNWYPKSWSLPDWAAQRGTVLPETRGDPQTPGWPSTDGLYRLPKNEIKMAPIPVQPIGYRAAHELMMYMKGPLNNRFTGEMHVNVSYRMGPGYAPPRSNWTVRLEVNNEAAPHIITNVLGVLKGHEEPDRYVIVGCHYDAWTYGASDPGAGSAVLMEVAHALGLMGSKHGWRPRRTIIFIHWDAEEQGLMGSYEWTEEYGRDLAEKTVAYINLDGAVRGNYTLRVHAAPLLRQLMFNVTKQLPGSQLHGTHPVEGETLFDVWKTRSPSDTVTAQPDVEGVGMDSDQAPFLFTLGIPVLWPRMTWNKGQGKDKFEKYPAYHTGVDTFRYQTQFLDPGCHGAEVLARVTGELVYQLASVTRLPLDVRELAQDLSDAFNQLRVNGTVPTDITLDVLKKAVNNLEDDANIFHERFINVDIANILATRRYNDAAMRVLQSFIHPDGLPNRPALKNILFGPSRHNEYLPSTFPGIRDAAELYAVAQGNDKTRAWQLVSKHISIAIAATRELSQILTNGLVS